MCVVGSLLCLHTRDLNHVSFLHSKRSHSKCMPFGKCAPGNPKAPTGEEEEEMHAFTIHGVTQDEGWQLMAGWTPEKLQAFELVRGLAGLPSRSAVVHRLRRTRCGRQRCGCR